jgi:Uma2 family endonuclease
VVSSRKGVILATKPEVQTKPITEEEYLALGSDVNAEIIDGELVIMSPNEAQHGQYSGTIYSFVRAFVTSRKLGWTFNDGTAYILRENPDHSLRDSKVPDVSYVSYERLPTDASLKQVLRLAPNLAVEVISPSERARDVMAKTRFYLEHNVEQVWLVFPDNQEVHIYAPDQPLGTSYGIDDTLTGGDVLPGFAVPICAIFDEQNNDLFVETLQSLLKTDS